MHYRPRITIRGLLIGVAITGATTAWWTDRRQSEPKGFYCPVCESSGGSVHWESAQDRLLRMLNDRTAVQARYPSAEIRRMTPQTLDGRSIELWDVHIGRDPGASCLGSGLTEQAAWASAARAVEAN